MRIKVQIILISHEWCKLGSDIKLMIRSLFQVPSHYNRYFYAEQIVKKSLPLQTLHYSVALRRLKT